MKRAFTFVEMLISVGIVTLIAGGVIIAMSRGASNVHRGSFNALAANQASWIVAIMRSDLARSDSTRVKFVPDSGNAWNGINEFSVVTDTGKKVSYSIETRGMGKVFSRSEEGGRKQNIAAEYLSEFSAELDKDCFNIKMILSDPGKKAVDFNWNARIYLPLRRGPDNFWKPFSKIND